MAELITRAGPTSLHYLSWGATFSPCMTYRYSLWRTWDESRPRVCWILLNPSTADHENNDPTNVRCEFRGRKLGFGGHIFVNCFALRSVDPAALKTHDDPVGPGCNEIICASLRATDVCIAGWGNDGTYRKRSAEVVKLAEQCGVTLHALHVTGFGQPAHPLYLSYKLKPFIWKHRKEIA